MPANGRKKNHGSKKLVGGELKVRRLTLEDYDQIKQLQLACFPGMSPWDPDQFESQIKTFPQGQICITYEGRIIASSSSLIVDFDFYSDWHNWKEIADNGYIRNHAPQGDTLYGIEIMVDPAYRGYRLARRLYDARKKIVRSKNLARIIIGGRIPGYSKFAEEMSANEYVERVMSKELFDQVLTVQLSNGFKLKQIIDGYYPSDSESRGYATFLEWINLDYRPDGKRQFLASQSVRIALVQYEMRRIESFKEFARHCEFFVDSGADYNADFLLFPELFTTQLLSFDKPRRPGLDARQLAEYTPQYIELFTKMAIKYNINIIAGSQFTLENEKLYNISYLFRRDGSIGKQAKLHITSSEKKWWGVSGGDKLEVFDTDRGRIAILICYDIEFPELSRIAASKGAQIIFVPFNTNDRYGYLRVRYCAQARCIENHLFTVITGCTGNLPDVSNADIHYAQSGIFTPSDVMFARDGVLAECTPNIETVIVHDVDIEFLRRHRYSGTTLNWQDRRKDLYRVEYMETDKKTEI